MWLFDLFFPQFCKSDISKYFRESLGLWDNESRLYFTAGVNCVTAVENSLDVLHSVDYFLILWEHWAHSLREQAYSNILKILPPKNECFQMKILNIFHISAQKIDCGYSLEPPRRGGSNEYPKSMF